MSVEYCKKDSYGQRNIAPNICCFDLDTGKLCHVFNSCYDAAEFLALPTATKILGSRIYAVCKAKKGHAYGYIWRFEADYLNQISLSAEELQLEHSNPRAKKVICIDKNNNITEYTSAVEFAKTISSDKKKIRYIAKTINESCRGSNKYKTYLGFQ